MNVSSLVQFAACAWLFFGQILIAGEHDHAYGDDVVVPQKQTGVAKKAPVAVNYLGTEGNLVRMELSGNYNRDNPDGSFNLEARSAVANAFYANHDDEFDFLVVFTSFEFDTGDAQAFYVSLFNDIEGIGQGQIDVRSEFQNSEKLQGYIDMAALSRYEMDSLQPAYDSTLDTLLHETMHRWGMRALFQDGGDVSEELRGYQGSHWGQYISSDASLMGGSRWRDNGDGTFTAMDVRYGYNPVDLYLAGFLPANQVPDLFFIRNPEGDPNAYWPQVGDQTTGNRVDVTIDQIIEANGPRVPAYADAQRDFRAAFILITPTGYEAPANVVAEISDLQKAYATRFSVLTRGLGVMRTNLKETDASSAGTPVTVSGGTPLGGTADFSAAAQWLLDNQQPGGYWQDKPLTRVLDTVHAVHALELLNIDDPKLDAARTWLRTYLPVNNDERAWLLYSGVLQGAAVEQVDALLANRNEDGSWGLIPGLEGSHLDTALVLGQLAAAGSVDQDVLDEAAAFLGNKSGDAWGPVAGGQSRLHATARAIDALLTYGTSAADLTPAVIWLQDQQLGNGSFGDGTGTAHETALILQTLSRHPGASASVIDNAAIALEGLQTADGSWAGSVYATAQSLLALRGRQNPNLQILGDVAIDPVAIVDGDGVATSFRVKNTGLLETGEVIARLYAGDPAAGGVQLGADLAVPFLAPGDEATIEAVWDSYGLAGSQDFTIWVDAAEAIDENNETDNLLVVPLEIAAPSGQADLQLLGWQLDYTPLAISVLPTELTVNLPLRNPSTADVTGADVALQWQVDGEPWETLDTQTVDIAARTEQAMTFHGSLPRTGVVQIRVVADPDNALAESNEGNNTVVFDMDQQASLDLAVLAEDLSLNGVATSGEDAVFTAVVRNLGTTPSPQVLLQAFVDGPEGSQQILSQTVQFEAGEVSSRQLLWRAAAVGSYTLRVVLDSADVAIEGNEGNNEATLPFEVISSTQPNLQVDHEAFIFDPLPALEGQTFTVTLPIVNTSNIAAGSFRVDLHRGVPGNGGILLASQEFTDGVAGSSSVNAVLVTPPLTGGGETLFCVTVDADDTVTEHREDDNKAFEVVEILRLPDLSVTPGNLALIPAVPVPGEPISALITVDNLSQQPALDVAVELFEVDGEGNETSVGTTTIANLVANSSDQVTINWTFGSAEGISDLRLVVDGANAVPETDETNNEALVPTQVQDRRFFASQRYISPDGNGLQDSTELAYSLDETAILAIEIRDKYDRLVRSFNDGALASGQLRGSIIWDGRDDDEVLVRDGDYRVRLRDDNNTLLGQLVVTVDTNRTPILDAAGTPSAYLTDLRCSVSSGNNLKFSVDGQYAYARGIRTLAGDNLDGLYRIATRGEGVDTLVDENWLATVADPTGGDYMGQIWPLDDGRLVFSTGFGCGNCDRALWLMETPTSQPQQLDVGPFTQFSVRNANTNFILIDGYADGNHIGRVSLDPSVPGEILNRPQYSYTRDELPNGVIAWSSEYGEFNGEELYLERVWFVSMDPSVPPVFLGEGPRIKVMVSADGGHVAVLGYQEFFEDLGCGECKRADLLARVSTWDVSSGVPSSLFEYEEHFSGAFDYHVDWTPDNRLLVMDGANARIQLRDRHGFVQKNYKLPTSLYDEYMETVESLSHYYGFRAYNRFDDFRFDESPVRWDEKGENFVLNSFLYVNQCIEIPHKNGEAGKKMECDFGGPEKRAELFNGVHIAQILKFSLSEDEPEILATLNQTRDENIIFPNQLDEWVEPSRIDWLPRTDRLMFDRYGDLLTLELLPEVTVRPLELGDYQGKWPANIGAMVKKLLVRNYPLADESDCENGYTPYHVYESADNMLAHLSLGQSGLILELKGVAADLNLANHQLDWAYASAPDTWYSLTSPSTEPVVDDLLATWVPPEPDNYHVRLTVRDKAGNSTQVIRKVTWFDRASLAGVKAEPRYISPNGDGMLDDMSVTFRVLEPLHLDVTVETAEGHVVRTLSGDYPLVTGEVETLTWDGRDEAGNIVPDGPYLVRVQNRRFRIAVDNTPPELTIEKRDVYSSIKGAVWDTYKLRASVKEANLVEALIDFQGPNGGRHEYARISGRVREENYGYGADLDQVSYLNDSYRITASDRAGNRALLDADPYTPELVFKSYRQLRLLDGEQVVEAKGLPYLPKPFLDEEDFPRISVARHSSRLALEAVLAHTVEADAFFIDFAEPGPRSRGQEPNWISLPVESQGVDALENLEYELQEPFGAALSAYRHLFFLPFDQLTSNSVWVRVRAVVDGTEVSSNIVEMVIEATLRIGVVPEDLIAAAEGSLEPEEDVTLLYDLVDQVPAEDPAKTQFWVRESVTGTPTSVRLVVTSSDDARYANPVVFLPKAASFIEEPSEFSGYIFEVATQPCNTYQLHLEMDIPDGSGGSNFLSTEDPVSNIKFTYSRSCIELETELKPVLGVQCVDQPTGEVRLEVDMTTDRGQLPVALNVYAMLPDGPLLVANTPAPHLGFHSFNIDTTGIAEGQYFLRVEAIDSVGERTFVNQEFPVDRTPAEVTFDYPGNDEQICAEVLEDGTIRLPLEGVVRDANPVTYDVYIGNGHDAPRFTRLTDPEELTLDLDRAYFGELAEYRDPDEDGNAGWLLSGEVTARIIAKDWSGASVCVDTRFILDVTVDAAVEKDFGLISPNGDDAFDNAEVSVLAYEPLFATVHVFAAGESADGERYSFGNAIDTLMESQPIAGEWAFPWSGTDALGNLLPDGKYALVFTFEDPCGLTKSFESFGEIDTTPPAIAIDYPLTGDPLHAIVEVMGSFTDLNFSFAEVSFAEADANPLWSRLEQHRRVVEESDLIATWPLTGLQGNYLLRLMARDAAANEAEVVVPIEVTMPTILVWSLDGEPRLFSPNGDGVLDTSNLAIGLQGDAIITAEIRDAGNTRRRLLVDAQTLAPGTHFVTWDGTDDSTNTLPDGEYQLFVTADDVGGSGFHQEESLTLVVDNTAPDLALENPGGNVIQGVGRFTATFSDEHPNDLRVFYSDEAGNEVRVIEAIDNGRHSGGELADLEETTYTARAIARDLAGNVSEESVVFTIDRTPPTATLTAPLASSLLGGTEPVTPIEGSAADTHFESYSLSTRQGSDGAWTQLTSSTEAPETTLLHTWNVTGPDGAYNLRLLVTDQAGWETEEIVPVIIDTTAPLASISAPASGSVVGSETLITGTASDDNLDSYRIQISAPGGSPAWADIHAGQNSVTDGGLMDWSNLPPDGTWLLRLLVTDKVGLTAEAQISLTLDTQPPEPPINLQLEVQPGYNVALNWTASPSDDTAGYRVFRNGLPISADLIAGTTYLDPDVAQGDHTYHVIAEDAVGNRSNPSNTVEAAIDRIPPDASLIQPMADSRVRGTVPVLGTATSPDDFYQYRLYVRLDGDPAPGELLRQSAVAVVAEVITEWDSSSATQENYYVFTLEAEDTAGNVASVERRVLVDNQPPAAPTGLAAVLTTSDDASVTWNPNSESDLAGYLLYRNGQLANAIGQPGEDLTPFLLSDPSYEDDNLSDGTHTYVVYAVDTAGNQSLPSSSAEVVVETGPPDLELAEPEDGLRFDRPLYVLGRSEDRDIADVLFEYAPAGTSSWVALGDADAEAPFESIFDPSNLGLEYGDYHIRATATDDGGQSDPTPAQVTVVFTDLEAPDPVIDLAVTVDGDIALLTWAASDATDLAGYVIYAQPLDIEGVEMTEVGTSSETNFAHDELALGNYRYSVHAVDTYDNLSDPSNLVDALVFEPDVQQPFSATSDTEITVVGTSPVAGTVSGTVTDDDLNTTAFGPMAIDAEGMFSVAAVALTPGNNTIALRVTDDAGNRSVEVSRIVIHGPLPEAPINLAASAIGNDVTFSWEPAPLAPDAPAQAAPAGYFVYRDGERLASEQNISGISWTASSRSTDAYRVGNTSRYSYWYPYDSDLQNDPRPWVQGTFAPTIVTSVTLQWYSNNYVPRDFSVQGWDGQSWIELARVDEAIGYYYYLEFDQPYFTDRLRVEIGDYNTQYWRPVRLGIFSPRSINLHPASPYTENLSDGTYSYTAATINGFGFVSPQATAVTVDVGDVVPPEPAVLSGSVSGVDATLTWTPSPSLDVVGYILFRDGNMIHGVSATDPLTYTDVELSNGDYTYHVVAVDGVSNVSVNSNAVTLTIDGDVPPAPVLSLVEGPGGAYLDLSWVSGGGEPDYYDLMRSLTPGGPYSYIENEDGPPTAYRDTDVEHGQTYYYVVYAYDSLGNQSDPSNEVSGTPIDDLAPEAPAIFVPTRPGITYVTEAESTNIGGTAEPGAQVQIRRNGEVVGTVTSPEEVAFTPYNYDSFTGNSFEVSPDGRYVLMQSYPNTITELSTGAVITLPFEDGTLKWAADSRRIYATHWSFDGQVRVFDIEGNLVDTPVEADDLNAAVPSPNDRYLAVVGERYNEDLDEYESGLWIVDDSGDDVHFDDSVSPWSIYSRTLTWAPDNNQLAFVADGDLYVLDVAQGERNLIAEEAYNRQLDWDGTSNLLMFTGYDGENQVFLADIDAGSVSALPETFDVNYGIGFSPDDRFITYVSDCCEVGLIDLELGEEADYFENYDYIEGAAWHPNGTVYLFSWRLLSAFAMPGYFSLPDMFLSVGDNTVTATAMDTAGNVSDPSQSILIQVTGAGLPDLAILEGDLTVLPAAGLPTDAYRVNLQVRNQGDGESEATDIVLRLTTPDGNVISLLEDTSLPAMDGGERLTFSADLPPEHALGTYRLTAIVDGSSVVREVDEANNLATGSFRVQETLEPTVALQMDSTEYPAQSDVTGSVEIYNPGPAFSGRLLLTAEDDFGFSMGTVLDVAVTDLEYAGTLTLPISWDTATIFAGTYHFQALLESDTGESVDSADATFSVGPSAEFGLALSLPRNSYLPYEEVDATASISYLTGNTPVIDALLTWNVIDGSGGIVREFQTVLGTMLPGYTGSRDQAFTLSEQPAGTYRLRVTLDADFVSEQTELVFSLEEPAQTVALSGDIPLTGANVALGLPFSVPFQVENSGEVDVADVPLTLQLLQASDLTEVATHATTTSLVSGASQNFGHEFSTEQMGLESYLLLLQADLSAYGGDAATVLASASLTGVDAIAPILEARTPLAGAVVGADVSVNVFARDMLSSVNRVNLILDGGVQQPMGNTGQVNIYLRELFGLSEGEHTLAFNATDTWANLAELPAYTFYVDLTPPTITIDGVVDGHVGNQPVTLTITIEDPNMGTSMVMLNGENFTSGDTVSSEGPFVLTVTATDLGGNTSEATVSFELDFTAPPLVVNHPTPGALILTDTTSVTGTSEAGATVTLVNGAHSDTTTADASGDFSFNAVPLTLGLNNLVVDATDRAGNTADTQVVPVTYELPNAEVTGILGLPTDPVAIGDTLTATYELSNTGNLPLTDRPLRATVFEAGGLGVGSQSTAFTLSPGAATSGGLFFDTAAWEPGTYRVDLEAQVEVDGPWEELDSGLFTLSDQTPPTVTLLQPGIGDLVAETFDVTGQAQDAHSEPVTVTYSLDGGAYQPMALVDGATNSYAAQVADATDGSHTVVLRAADAAGNSADSASHTFVVDAIAPVITITGVAQGDVANAPVTPVITIDEDHPDVETITLDGQPFVSGTTITAEGTHELVVTATDRVGHSATRTVQFEIDTTLPVVTITSPADGAIVGVTEIDLTGTTEPGAFVFLTLGATSEQVQADASGAFTFNAISLSNGANIFTFYAVDRASNQGPDVLHTVNLVTDPPAVTWLSPANGSTVEPDFDTAVSVEEQGFPVVRVELWVDNLYAGIMTPDPSTPGNYIATLTGVGPGEHQLQAFAIDTLDNSGSSALVHITVETPGLDLVITAPTEGEEIDSPTVTVTGTSEDGAVLNLTTSGGYTASTNVVGTTFTFNDVPMTAGPNTITVDGTLGSAVSQAVVNVNGACHLCGPDTIVIDEDMTVDVANGTITGDQDLAPYLTVDTSATDPHQWLAAFHLDGQSLSVTNGATITVANVPFSRGTASPGLTIDGACAVNVDADSSILVQGNNATTGALNIEARGHVTIAGHVTNRIEGTWGTTGELNITSTCGDITTATTSRIVLDGTQEGARDMSIRALAGDLHLTGIVDVVYTWNRKASLLLAAYAGNITIDGTTYQGIDETGRPTASGVNVRCRSGQPAGDLNILAGGDITVNGYGYDARTENDSVELTLDANMRGGEVVIPVTVNMVNVAPDQVDITLTATDGTLKAFFGNLADESLVSGLAATGDDLNGKFQFAANGVNGIPNAWMQPPGNWDLGVGFIDTLDSPTSASFTLTASGLTWQQLLAPQVNHWAMGVLIDPGSGKRRNNEARMGMRSPWFEDGKQFGTVALKSKNHQGGNLSVRSLGGSITATDYAFDGANANNGNATHLLEACGDVQLLRSGSGNSALDGDRVVLDGSSNGPGAANTVRSANGNVIVGEGAAITADGNPAGTNHLESCNGVTTDGTVDPPDPDPGDDQGSCGDPTAAVIGSTPASGASTSTAYTYTVTLSAGSADTFAVLAGPSGAAFNGSTLNWTPGADQVGTHSVVIAAMGPCAIVTQEFTITVAAAGGLDGDQ